MTVAGEPAPMIVPPVFIALTPVDSDNNEHLLTLSFAVGHDFDCGETSEARYVLRRAFAKGLQQKRGLCRRAASCSGARTAPCPP